MPVTGHKTSHYVVANWPFNAADGHRHKIWLVQPKNTMICGNSIAIYALTFAIEQFPGSTHCGNNEKKVGLRNQAGCHPKSQWSSAHFLIQTTDAWSSSNIMTMPVNFSVPHTTVVKSLFAQKICGQTNFSRKKVANLIKRLSMHDLGYIKKCPEQSQQKSVLWLLWLMQDFWCH